MNRAIQRNDETKISKLENEEDQILAQIKELAQNKNTKKRSSYFLKLIDFSKPTKSVRKESVSTMSISTSGDSNQNIEVSKDNRSGLAHNTDDDIL